MYYSLIARSFIQVEYFLEILFSNPKLKCEIFKVLIPKSCSLIQLGERGDEEESPLHQMNVEN